MSEIGSTEMSIRPFLASDIAHATALWQRTQGVGLSEADAPDRLIRFLNRNPDLSQVALCDGELIGTVLCGHDGRRGLIHHLVVDSARQRAGIATKLLSTALARLKQARVDKAHLLVFRDNELGLAFWQQRAVERHEMSLFSVSTEAP